MLDDDISKNPGRGLTMASPVGMRERGAMKRGQKEPRCPQ